MRILTCHLTQPSLPSFLSFILFLHPIWYSPLYCSHTPSLPMEMSCSAHHPISHFSSLSIHQDIGLSTHQCVDARPSVFRLQLYYGPQMRGSWQRGTPLQGWRCDSMAKHLPLGVALGLIPITVKGIVLRG